MLQQQMKEKIIQLLAFLVILGIALTVKFGLGVFATSAIIETKNITHSGWDSAKYSFEHVPFFLN